MMLERATREVLEFLFEIGSIPQMVSLSFTDKLNLFYLGVLVLDSNRSNCLMSGISSIPKVV